MTTVPKVARYYVGECEVVGNVTEDMAHEIVRALFARRAAMEDEPRACVVCRSQTDGGKITIKSTQEGAARLHVEMHLCRRHLNTYTFWIGELLGRLFEASKRGDAIEPGTGPTPTGG